jgi:type IV pilus assembly protein PilB
MHMIEFNEDKQNQKIDELHRHEEEELVQILAANHGLDYVDLTITLVNTDALRLVDENIARQARLVAYSLVDKKVKIAARNPDDPKAKAVIDSLTQKGYEPQVTMTSSASLEKAWSSYKDLSFAYETKAGSLDVSSEEISNIAKAVNDLPSIIEVLKKTLEMKKSYRVSKILETILAGGLATGASDIHIEPEEQYIRLRYRLDGVLVPVIEFDRDTYHLLLSRIKLLSGLKLNIKKDAQDGRFSVKIGDDEIEIRTSMLPGAYDESIVLRLLNPKSISVPLENLGIPKKLLKILLKEIQKPKGMLLTTGPTGSGKTTTLYAFLKKVHDPGVKIITIEDPIEYHLPGIVQTQVNDKGYTFLDGLRSALRQDPDIIMIGEIRDGETAAIAINSSLTGHLVFSTLHTNSAAGAFPRLIDLGINPKIMSSAINIVIAQRLLRRLCPYCHKAVAIEGEIKQKIDDVLNTVVDKTEIPPIPASVFTAAGCEKCNMTGYKGRIGIYEGMKLTEDVNKVTEYGSSESDIEKAAAPQAILTMKQDGIIKVLQGITSVDELERVITLVD